MQSRNEIQHLWLMTQLSRAGWLASLMTPTIKLPLALLMSDLQLSSNALHVGLPPRDGRKNQRHCLALHQYKLLLKPGIRHSVTGEPDKQLKRLLHDFRVAIIGLEVITHHQVDLVDYAVHDNQPWHFSCCDPASFLTCSYSVRHSANHLCTKLLLQLCCGLEDFCGKKVVSFSIPRHTNNVQSKNSQEKINYLGQPT